MTATRRGGRSSPVLPQVSGWPDGGSLRPSTGSGGQDDGPVRRDRGSGTVLVLGAIAVLVAMTVGALLVVSAVVAAHRAQSAADLAALAAAGALVRGQSPPSACATGAGVATRNGGRLATCSAGADLSVEVAVDMPASAAHIGTATARSRAGPAGSAGVR